MDVDTALGNEPGAAPGATTHAAAGGAAHSLAPSWQVAQAHSVLAMAPMTASLSQQKQKESAKKTRDSIKSLKGDLLRMEGAMQFIQRERDEMAAKCAALLEENRRLRVQLLGPDPDENMAIAAIAAAGALE